MTDVRELSRRLRLGEPDRRIARDLSVSRYTVARYPKWATQQGVLDGPLPDCAALAELLRPVEARERLVQEQSCVESFREQVKLSLHRAQEVGQGSGDAVIIDGTLTTRVKDLKPHSVYTVWFVNTDPKHEMAGVGQPPYRFRTEGRGAGTFTARREGQPLGAWQMRVIIRHPNGNPQDMEHVEDTLWASIAKASGKSPANPCAAR